LSGFERGKGSQVAVLMLPTTEPETIEEYSIRVADAWKIGRARVDDGVILVVAKDDRKLRVEVGRGLEGAIPDAVAKRVVSGRDRSAFPLRRFLRRRRAGTGALMKLIEGEGLPAPPVGSDHPTAFTPDRFPDDIPAVLRARPDRCNLRAPLRPRLSGPAFPAGS